LRCARIESQRGWFTEILVPRYGLTLVIGTKKNMASTGVFVRVICALRHSIKNFP
jgi:hypothetical protein